MTGRIQGNNELLNMFRCIHWIFADTVGESLHEIPDCLGCEVGSLSIDVGPGMEFKKPDDMCMFT